MNTKLGVAEIRKAILDEIGDKKSIIENMSDDKLLHAGLSTDLGLDSLDVISVTMVLERKCGIIFPDHLFDVVKKRGNTVEILLEEFNKFLTI